MPKKRKSETSIEDIYRNKLFVPPKEQNLETIFEEPRQSKDGAPILTSVKKYKRYLHFDDTKNKIEKRKRKVKKYFKKLKTGSSPVTRSSPKDSSVDESLYDLHLLGVTSDGSSSDSDSGSEVVPRPKKWRLSSSFDDLKNVEHSDALKDVSSCTDVIETPKRSNYKFRSDLVKASDNNDESLGRPKDSKSVDESLYKLHLLGVTSVDSLSDSDSDSEVPRPKKRRLSSSFDDLKNVEHSDALKDGSRTDVIETPKRSNHEYRSSLSRKESDCVKASDNNDETPGLRGGIDSATDDADSRHIQNDSDAPVESPRRLPQKSMEILSF